MVNRIGAAKVWCYDPEVWRFVLPRYLMTLAPLNALWEIAQLPLYTLWSKAPPTYIAYAILHCTLGDILIGSGALLLALIITRASALSDWCWFRIGAVVVALGFAYTAFSEWFNTSVRGSWTYSEWMPLTPFVPIGVSPLLQWLLVPVVALAFTHYLTVRYVATRAIK